MELILKEDVQNLGFKDDLVSVKNGYGRNFLIPKGLATLATPSAKKVLAENLRQRAHKEKKVIDAANKVAEALKTLELKIKAKAGAGDKLFGSVTSIDLAAALEKEGHEIDKKFINILGGTVKRTGVASAQVRLHRDVIIDFPFEVVADK
ncbi:50S ribosomal protein L9 [Maribacter polysiphoniae]|uniref:Large ribosomal subunit protein bL9 n=1 Tax=Maribacter polysiphoniae TaxID=429344 RepID=A0A316DZK1_9FLAO|nr:50S ribosomal protein L9 [Maribacter polysiphoniae]MBD1261194.1 50S ribosomal protein L9 [Maribacter polysiphoniae]PWK23564.1 LSU ribosomal protein L9P [Maribacter polysiphoniae]